MFNFRLIFALSLLGVALALGTAVSHYRQQVTELVKVGNLQRYLAELNQHHTEKLNAAEQENSALRAELASGSRRMRITATCPAQVVTVARPKPAAWPMAPSSNYLQEYIRSVCLK